MAWVVGAKSGGSTLTSAAQRKRALQSAGKLPPTPAKKPTGVSPGARPVATAASNGNKSDARIAFDAKWHRARAYEAQRAKEVAAARAKLAAQAKASTAKPVARTTSTAPRVASTASRPAPAKAVAVKPAAPAKKAPTSAERAAYDAKYRRAREIEKAQAAQKQLSEYMKQSSAAVSMELQPKLNELTRQIEDLQARGERSFNDTTQNGQRSVSDLNELFGRLANFTGQTKAASNTAYEGLKSGMGSAYDQLVQAVGGNYQNASQIAGAENERLGLQGTAPEAMGGMQRDLAFLQGLAQTDKTAQVAGLGASQQAFDSLMGMQQDSARAEGGSRIAQSMNQTNKTLSDLMFELESGTRELEGARGDVEMGRGEKMRQMIEALQERDYSRRMEQQQISFEQQLAQQRFGLEKQQVTAALTPQPASYADQLDAALKEMQIASEKARLEQLKRPASRPWPTTPNAGAFNAAPSSFFPGRY